MDDVLEVEQQDDAVRFRVRVAPRASRARVVGTYERAVKISLTAPPVDGAANAALIKFLAGALGVSRRRVSIVRGERSRTKTLRVEGIVPAAVHALVADPGC